MEPVEQVILYVRTTGRKRTVEMTNATELVRTSDVAELVGWFDQDGVEAVLRFDSPNLFFHPLPSGDYAVGIVFPRSDYSFFVRVLVVPPNTLLNFSNNPIALYRDLIQRQKIPLFRRPPRRVHPLKVSQGGPTFDRQVALKVVDRFGAAAIVRLIRSLRDSLSTFFTSPLDTLDVIDAVLNFFPVRLRTELTFSTELFFFDSPPLRLVGSNEDRQQLAELAKALGVPLLDVLESEPTQDTNERKVDKDPWSHLITNFLRTGNFDFFESHLNDEVPWSFPDESGEPPSAVEMEPSIELRASIATSSRQRELLAQIDSAIIHATRGDNTAISPLQNAWQELQRLLPWNEQDRIREEFIARIHSVFVKSSARTPVQRVGFLDLLLVFLRR